MSRKRITIPFSDIEVKAQVGDKSYRIAIKGLKSFAEEPIMNKKKMAEYYTDVLGTNVSRRTVGRRLVEMVQLEWTDMLREDLLFSMDLKRAKEAELVEKSCSR